MKKKTSSKKGFTFIETLIYITLATMVIGILFAYGWNVVMARVKANTMRETESGAEVLSEILKREIRSASEVKTDQSVFDNAPGKLVLNTADGEVTIEANNDKVSIKRGSASPQWLHPDTVRMRDLKFTAQLDGAGLVQYVGFSFTAEAYYPAAGGRSEYEFSIPIEAGAELRNQ